jgi:hypothetical protein
LKHQRIQESLKMAEQASEIMQNDCSRIDCKVKLYIKKEASNLLVEKVYDLKLDQVYSIR